jgi:NTP pyrophosphatase (non-canonical NTP hydrolase)
MDSYQEQIRKFCDDRGWGKFHNPKDLLLGIVEEVGELRNIVKWEQDPEVLRKVLLDNRDEVKDNIGDIMWFLALLANGAEVNMEEAIVATIADNEKRFPLDKTKDHHTNLYLGGHDGKY